MKLQRENRYSFLVIMACTSPGYEHVRILIGENVLTIKITVPVHDMPRRGQSCVFFIFHILTEFLLLFPMP